MALSEATISIGLVNAPSHMDRFQEKKEELECAGHRTKILGESAIQ